MDNRFTPGPWAVTANGLNVKTATTDTMICEDGGETSAIESKANARLIAAAPELLDALISALAAMDHMGDILNDMDAVQPDDETHFGAFQKARDAIAKATS